MLCSLVQVLKAEAEETMFEHVESESNVYKVTSLLTQTYLPN